MEKKKEEERREMEKSKDETKSEKSDEKSDKVSEQEFAKLQSAMEVVATKLDDVPTRMAEPTPATHASLRVLTAGETVCQTTCCT